MEKKQEPRTYSMAGSQKPKPNNDTLMLNRPRAILLDIEGTISHNGFVSQTLFPFTINHMEEYFQEMYDTIETREIIHRLRECSKKHFQEFPAIAPGDSSRATLIRSVSEYALAHILQRSRISEMKQLQIAIWIWAYEKGQMKGHVYDEVTTILHHWKYHLNIPIYLFSSAMIKAQQLLLSYTNHGNCLPLINDHFDSSIGDKCNAQSYLNIAKAINQSPENILFITDNINEAKAARNVSCECCLIKRTMDNHDHIRSATPFSIAHITTLMDIHFHN